MEFGWGGGGDFLETFLEGSVYHIFYRDYIVNRRPFIYCNLACSGLEKEHFRWLCRFMARWHRRHAGKCDVMAGWSSGDTGDDTSGDEETLVKRHKKRRERRMVKKGEKRAASGVSDSEDTDGVETVSE